MPLDHYRKNLRAVVGATAAPTATRCPCKSLQRVACFSEDPVCVPVAPLLPFLSKGEKR